MLAKKKVNLLTQAYWYYSYAISNKQDRDNLEPEVKDLFTYNCKGRKVKIQGFVNNVKEKITTSDTKCIFIFLEKDLAKSDYIFD